MSKLILTLALAVSAAASAQTATPPPTDFSPPPMVPVQPPPMPAAEPGTQLVDPGTPPPPSALPPPGYVPGPQSNYPYSPYGNPKSLTPEAPPFEWGLMISESLFGMLTSAGVSLIPYFLLLRPMVTQGAVLGDAAISTVVFVLIFSAVPLAVSQTQLSLANGSRHYTSEAWPAALAGLGAQGAILGLFFLLPRQVGFPTNTEMSGRNEIFLLIGSIAIVPLIQMVVINLTKSPRSGRIATESRGPPPAFALQLPTLAPLLGQTRQGLAVGMQASLLNVRW